MAVQARPAAIPAPPVRFVQPAAIAPPPVRFHHQVSALQAKPRPIGPPPVAQRKGKTALQGSAVRPFTIQRATEASYAGTEDYLKVPSKPFRAWFPAEDPPSSQAEGQQWIQQGWKIHIGTTPRHAEAMLALCLPVIRRLGIGHKVVSSPTDFDAFEHDAGQKGKLITIYPCNKVQFSQAWSALREVLLAEAQDLDRSPTADHEIVLESTFHMTARYGGYMDDWLRHTTTGKNVKKDDRSDPYPPPEIGYVEYPDQIIPRLVRQNLLNSRTQVV